MENVVDIEINSDEINIVKEGILVTNFLYLTQ